MTDRVRITIHHQKTVLSARDHKMLGVIARPSRGFEKIPVARFLSKYSTRHGAHNASICFLGNSSVAIASVAQENKKSSTAKSSDHFRSFLPSSEQLRRRINWKL